MPDDRQAAANGAPMGAGDGTMTGPETTSLNRALGFIRTASASGQITSLIADESEAVLSEITRLRTALERIAASAGPNMSRGTSGDGHARCIHLAREALCNG